MRYHVEIVSYATGEVVKRLKASSERQAEKVDRGININLNHDEYYTRVVRQIDEADQVR
jgi:hypothetical protein